jgi:hypothetical protein
MVFATGCESSNESTDVGSESNLIEEEVNVVLDDEEDGDLAKTCTVAVPDCGERGVRFSYIDGNGCEHVLCNSQIPEKKEEATDENEEASESTDTIDNSRNAPEAFCNVRRIDGSITELSSYEGFIDTYVAVYNSSYYPQKGRYVVGGGLFCEKQVVRCTFNGEGKPGKIAGKRTRAYHLADRDRSRCNASLFENTPNHRYSQYRKWYESLKVSYERCLKREPSPQEVQSSTERLLANQITERDLELEICN